MNDATQPASNDSKPARITIPFSEETPSAQVLDSKLLANSAGLPANPREKVVSSHKTLSASPLYDASFRKVAFAYLLERDDVTPAEIPARERTPKQP